MLDIENLRSRPLLLQRFYDDLRHKLWPVCIQREVNDLHDLRLEWQRVSPNLPEYFQEMVDALNDLMFPIDISQLSLLERAL